MFITDICQAMTIACIFSEFSVALPTSIQYTSFDNTIELYPTYSQQNIYRQDQKNFDNINVNSYPNTTDFASTPRFFSVEESLTGVGNNNLFDTNYYYPTEFYGL
ncbi:5270_t:CDS:2 [Scutellospora calospora]|uniref:5270_t:CDS:1 n=1 Tax=Scutellospora calospora TaxID=85575 RepID=A0ACA9KLQ5_9GLOM|nr:5270_t:CDS:2 [Scutellospora calospora]